jgi:hypothetical protein
MPSHDENEGQKLDGYPPLGGESSIIGTILRGE